MAVTVLVQISNPGAAVNYYSIYYDTVTPSNLLQSNVPVASISTGYIVSGIPDTASYLILVSDCNTTAFISIYGTTPTPTPTPHCGFDFTVGYGLTPTPTPTYTPTPTQTPSQTPTTTRTPSQTPTNTQTPTQTPTNTLTPTITRTPVPTGTVTRTPAITPSITPTQTVTPSHTPTPSITPSHTMTPSVTPTHTPTPTLTPNFPTVYYGTNITGAIPTSGSITAGVHLYYSPVSNITLDWTSLTVIPQYCWFAVFNAGIASEKNYWYVDSLNNGAIGGSENLFGSNTTVLVDGFPYNVYITNYETQFTSTCTLKNTP